MLSTVHAATFGTQLSWEPNTVIIDGPSLGQVMGVMDVMGEQA